MGAATGGVAAVLGAAVVILAGQQGLKPTAAFGAGIAQGAGVAVAARALDRAEYTAFERVAAVTGAGIAVFAGQRAASGAGASFAEIDGGTRVAIAAGAGIQGGVLAATAGLAAIFGARVAVIAALGLAVDRRLASAAPGCQHRGYNHQPARQRPCPAAATERKRADP